MGNGGRSWNGMDGKAEAGVMLKNPCKDCGSDLGLEPRRWYGHCWGRYDGRPVDLVCADCYREWSLTEVGFVA